MCALGPDSQPLGNFTVPACVAAAFCCQPLVVWVPRHPSLASPAHVGGSVGGTQGGAHTGALT